MAYDSAPSKPQLDEVGEIIWKARELLSDPAKWCQGAHSKFDAFCILGAMGLDHGNPITPKIAKAMLRIERHLPRRFQNDLTPIANFNDDDETSHGMILALLYRAAVKP